MVRIMIRCPETNQVLFTGQLSDSEAVKQVVRGKHGTGCPHCGELHMWNAADAWTEDAALTAH
jgi:hypothetical protein